ncbi:hypothetical protein EON67_06085 [archaeon]|nr:MAG: hypothetical protein EON67_06085 [archaeon]
MCAGPSVRSPCARVIMEATAATAPCTPAALSSALQCGICLGLLTEPLTLAACGHSFWYVLSHPARQRNALVSG